MLQTYNTRNQNEETMTRLRETVNTLLKTLINPDSLKRNIFFTLLHSVMDENNFVLNNTVNEPVSIVEYVLAKHSLDEAIHEALFVLDDFKDMPVKVIFCPLADLMLINATIPQMHKETYSVCFKIDKFMTISQLGMPVKFDNLDELFTTFKGRIVIPIKGAILNHYEYASGCLAGLPDDLVRLILLKMPIRDVLNLSECCKRMYAIIKEQSLWFLFHKRDFSTERVFDQQYDWVEAYKEIYVSTKAESSRLARNVDADSFEEFAVLPSHLTSVDSRWEVIL